MWHHQLLIIPVSGGDCWPRSSRNHLFDFGMWCLFFFFFLFWSWVYLEFSGLEMETNEEVTLTQGTRKSHPDPRPWTCLQLCFQFYQKLRFLCQTTNFPFFSLQCFCLISFIKWRRKYCLGVEKLPFLVLVGRPHDVWNKGEKRYWMILNGLLHSVPSLFFLHKLILMKVKYDPGTKPLA